MFSTIGCVSFFTVFSLQIASAAPMLSPDFSIAKPVHGATGGEQKMPVVAAAASGFLLVWVDEADAYTPPHRLLALRTDRNGAPIDREPFVISENPASQQGLSVASDGTNFLVVWTDTGAGANFRLFATLVRSNGTVLATNGVRLNATAIAPPRVIGGAEGFLMLWEDLAGPPIRGARISCAGDVLDPSGVAMDLLPSITGVFGSDGSNYIYVAEQFLPATSNYASFRWRIAQANASVSGAGQIEPGHTEPSDSYSLAFNGARFWLAASGLNTNTSLFLNPDGTFLASGPILPRRWKTASASANGEFLTLVPAYANDRLRALRFSGTGDLLSSDEVAIPSEKVAIPTAGLWSANGFAASSNAYLLFREDARDADVVACVLSTNGSLLRQFSPQGPNEQGEPAVATDGAEYLVAWHESRDGSNLLYAARVDASGGGATPGPLVVGDEGAIGSRPRVAYAGGVYLIVWTELKSFADVFPVSSILARRLSRAGVWLDSAPLLVYSNSFAPNVAASGTNFLVVWGKHFSHAYTDVYGTFIGTNGIVSTSPPFRISEIHVELTSLVPEATFDGLNYVVVWDNWGFIRARWRSLSPSGEFLSNEYSGPPQSRYPRLVRNGSAVSMAWYGGIATIGPAGSLVPPDGVPIGVSANSLASHGDTIWAAGTPFPYQSGPDHVALTALDSALNVTVPPFSLAEESSVPALASNGTNLLCAYLNPASTSVARTARVRMRLIYPDTTLCMSREAGLRLTGRAVHSFVIDRSSDLENWTPFHTNTAPGPFEFPISSGSAEFFRMQWYP